MGTHTNKQTNRWIEFYHLTKAKCKSAKCARSGCTTRRKKKTKHAGKKIGEQREKHKQQIEFVAAKLHRICAIQKQKSKAEAIILCSSFCRWPYTHGWYLNPWIVLSRTFNLFLWLFYSVVRSARSLAGLFVCLFVLIANLSLTISVDLKWKSCHILFCYCAFAFVYLYVFISVSCIAFFCV